MRSPLREGREDGRGVRVYRMAGVPPEEGALARLAEIAGMGWVAEPVVALPDLHWKPRLETPSSTAIATRSDIVLGFSSPSQNCGMSLLLTPLGEADLGERFLDALMDAIRLKIPRHRHRAIVHGTEVVEFCRKGAPEAARRFGIDPRQCRRIESHGNVLVDEEPSPEAVQRVMDRQCIEMGRYSFAFIGGGNHFLELQIVTQVLDARACETMGLEPGRVVVMLHTGSERLGHDLGRLYARRRKTSARRRRKLFKRKVSLHLMRDLRGVADLYRRWNLHFRRKDFVPVPAESRAGERLRLTLGIAANYGYANRIAVAGLLQQALRGVTGQRDLELRVVADLSHNRIQRERIGGELLWVHRHNAARAVGPRDLPDESPYQHIGQPVMIPSTNRTSSFVVVAREGAEASLYSVDHGAGCAVERYAAAGLLRPQTGHVTRRYSYGSPSVTVVPHLSDDAIEEVVSVLETRGLTVPAARLRPVAVLKA
ncbi:MAG: RtcB family protein [Acidobacteriota bacterium]